MGSRFQLAATLPFLVFLQIIHWVSGQYNVIRPHSSIIGFVGNGAVLPCQLQGKIVLDKLSIQWIFSRNSVEHGVATFDGTNPRNPFLESEAYQGRTEFFPSEFQQGNLSLLLKNIQPSDKGKYSCIIFLETWYNEGVVELDVAAQGAEPSVSLDGHAGNGISLSCRSQGWFPAPSMVWLDSQGQTRTEEVTTQSTPGSPPGVFDVVSSMSLEPGSDREVSCRVVNEVLNATRESRVRIADSFFPSPSPWMFASLAVLSLDLGIFGAVVCSITQGKKAVISRKKAKKDRECVKAELETQRERERNEAEKAEKGRQIERLRAELDFWDARSHAVSVGLGRKSWLLHLPNVRNVPHLSWQGAMLVSREALGARNCYWEVELGRERRWTLGVLRHRRILPGPHSLDSRHSRNFWALRGHNGQLYCFDCGSHHKLGKQQEGFSVVGVFLRMEKGRLEFYDVERRDLVVAMSLRTREDPAGKFFPFMSRGAEGPLRIHSVPIPMPL